MATRTDSLLDRAPRTPHLLNMQRGKAGELNQLWLELEHLTQCVEGNVGAPHVERVGLTGAGGCLSVSNGGTVNDAILVEGRGFIPAGWNRAMVNIDTGVANSGIDWWASQPGSDANAVSVEYIKGAGALAVAYNPVTRVVAVTLAAGGSTDVQVIAAVQADAASFAQVNPVPEYGSATGGTIIAAVAATHLTGGAGTALRCAELTVDPAGANNAVRYVARKPGPAGNDITIQYAAGGVGGAPPLVTVTGMAILVTLDAGTNTALNVIDAVNAHPQARRLVKAHRVYGDTGAGFPVAAAAAPLVGGTDGLGCRAFAGGKVGAVNAVTDETFLVSFGAMGESAVDEIAVVELNICGYEHKFNAVMIA